MRGAIVPEKRTVERVRRGGPSSPCRGRARHCRKIQRLDVIFYHPFGAELGRDGSDTLFDQLKPAARNAIEIALIEQWNRFLFQHPVHLFGVVMVLGLHIRVSVQRLNSPAVRAVVPFLPPAIERTEMEGAVERGLHSAGTARFHRKARRVEPDVHALHEVLGHMHLIIFQKGDVAAQLVIVAKGQHFMNEITAWFVGRMGFAGEHQLDRPPLVLQDSLETFQILEQQCGPLVGGEAPRKSDREGFGIEKRAAAQHLGGLQMTVHPAIPRPFANESHQLTLHRLANGPEFVVGDV